MSSLFPRPPRRFVPSDLDAGSIEQLEALFDELAARTTSDLIALQRWMLDESELLSTIDAEVARRYVRMTCHTEDARAKDAFLQIEQTVVPRMKVRTDELDRKFLASPALAELPDDQYGVVIRRRRTQASLFREENTELQRQESELSTKHQALMGGVTVEFDGKQLTLQQLGPYLECQERDVRELAYRTGLAARRRLWPDLASIYDPLIELRTAIARNAGFPTYTPYRFLELGRYDYTEQTCRQLHDAIAEHVAPAVRVLDARRARRLGLPRLRPWDLDVDPDGRPPPRPFTNEAELIGRCRRLIAAVDPAFATWLDELQRRDLLDLMSRKGKAPGGYQYQLEDERVPFIFANSAGVHQNVQTLLHECGHAFHSLLCRDHDLLSVRDYPIEIAETASMSMELFGLEHLDRIYDADDARAVRKKHLEGSLRMLLWIASIDAFQHWVYGNPQHTHDERRVAWLDVCQRFSGDVDWSGLEDAYAMQWIAQSHLFNHPFYYIEYAIAQMCALQNWQHYRTDSKRTLAAYRSALVLGGSRPLPELFAAMDVRFDPSPAVVRDLVADVVEQSS